MSTQSANQTVLEVITDALVGLGAEQHEISSEATFANLDIDSLDLVELGMIVEERYGMKLTGADVVKIKTVGDLVALIENRA